MSLALVALCLIWGSTWLVVKAGLRDLPPLSAAAFRFSVAAVLLAAVGRWLHRLEGGLRPPVHLVLAMGALNFALSYGIVYTAETVIPSGLASVLWAVFPLVMALMGHRFLPGERLDARSLTGFCVGLLGVAMLFVMDLRAIGPDALGLGALLLVSPIAAALGQTVVKRDGGRASATLLNRDAMILGAGLLWCAALLTEHPLDVQWTTRAAFSVAYLATLGTVVSFGLYFWLLRFLPSNRLSLIAYVTPAVALWLGWLVDGEPLAGSTVGGTALIFVGVALVVRARPGHDPV